jgi:peptidoglycan-associated lipoprotein
MSKGMQVVVVSLVLVALGGSACARRRPPAAPAPAPTFEAPTVTPAPPAPPQRVDDAQPVATPSLADDSIANRSLDDLNRDSPLRPAFFPLDSSDLDDAGRAIVTANAALLKKFATWMISIEGHCDERGTPEYNLALGERRAVSVKTYLVSLGVSPDRLRTVSYGKEFPFDPAHTEDAWSKNRRAHFVITSK